jgi:hypothetical protein
MNVKRLLMMTSVVTILMFFATGGWGSERQNVVQQIVDNGRIDWTEGVIQATGIGAPPEKFYGKPQAVPMAVRAAQLDAYRRLLEVTKGVRVDSQTVVEDDAVKSDIINSQVEGMVKGAQVVKKEYLSDGSVEVTLQMSLRGGFAQLMLPLEIQQVEKIRSIPETGVITTPQDITPETSDIPTSGARVHTGLVIDARGLGARPAMSPKIVDETGKEVYGAAYASREFAVQQGMCGYARDLTAAQQNPRVTNDPLIVKGLRTQGPGKSDIVISNADATKILSSSENLSFLQKCRVMIVLD